MGNPQLIQFSREVIDLLKSQPACLLPIHKFIPSYHHHFAKQCRVSDYGYPKLLELLEAVPHVLQVRTHTHTKAQAHSHPKECAHTQSTHEHARPKAPAYVDAQSMHARSTKARPKAYTLVCLFCPYRIDH